MVDAAGDLQIVGGLHELNTGECARGDDAGAAARFRAPRDKLALGVGDLGVRFRGTPNAKV